METVKDTMVKLIKKTDKYGHSTFYDVYFNDGKLSEVSVYKNNAWNYTMTDRDKGLAITYNDDFAFYFKNLKMAFDMIERFENDLNLGRGKDMFNIKKKIIRNNFCDINILLILNFYYQKSTRL